VEFTNLVPALTPLLKALAAGVLATLELTNRTDTTMAFRGSDAERYSRGR
jgi:hypothetical protein